MKKVLLAILILALSLTAAAKPVQVGTVESVSENTAFSDSSSASLNEETDILGQLIFYENFDGETTRVSGDAIYSAVGKNWNYVSPDVTDSTFGYSTFRFLRGDSGFNGSALMTKITDGDNGYMWVRTDASKTTTYPGFIFQFRNSNNNSVVVKEGTYTLCIKVYSPEGNDIASAGIRARVTDGVDGYGYRSGNLIDPSTTWETYLPAEQGTWSYIWSTYTASESEPLSGFYVMNNGGNAEGKADFRSFYIDDISLYYIPSDKTAANSYTFTFVDGENQTTKTVDELTKVTLPTPFSDKTFLGWAETQNGEPLSNTSLIALCDKTLYAVWGEKIKTNPVTNVDFFANAPLDAASAVYGNETTLKNFTTGASTCNVTHAILRDSDGTDYRRFLAQADGDLKFQFSYGVDNGSSYVAFDDTKGAVVKLRLNVPTDSTQPSGNLTVKNIFSLKEGGFLDPAATAYIDTSVIGKWQYVYFDYSSISGKNGSMRRFDVFGLKDGWSIDVDYIHFILDDDVVYSVLTPQITVETSGENAYVKYTFDGECALSSTEFDAIAGGHGFGTSTKTADENGNSVYTYTTTLNNVSGTALPSVVKSVTVEAGKLSGVYLPYVRFDKIKLPRTASFNANGGEGTSPALTYYDNQDLTLPENTFTKENYVFVGWEASLDGKIYEAGEVIPAEVIGEAEDTLVLTAIWKHKSIPTSYNENSIRINDPSGIRFKASVRNEIKADEKTTEYGYIVTRASLLGSRSAEYLTFEQTDVQYVFGVSYGYDTNSKQNVDRVFETEDGNTFFTAVIYGIKSEKAAYEEDIVVRPYIKYDGVTLYGEPMSRSVLSVAKALRDGGYEKLDDYGKQVVQNILNICGESL